MAPGTSALLAAPLPEEARAVIAALNLAPHPEGGYFRETFRDETCIGGRAASTAIYFLLPQGVTSLWHRIDAVETWHWYAGSPMNLRLSRDGAAYDSHNLGPGILSGERPQLVVPVGCWQQGVSLGAWTLVGCTVVPGFRFSGFDLAPVRFNPEPSLAR